MPFNIYQQLIAASSAPLASAEDIEYNKNTLDPNKFENITTVGGKLMEIEDALGNVSTLKPITYANLVILKNQSKLIPGAKYRITNYVTTATGGTELVNNTNVAKISTANNYFDIIVEALDTNVLSENAKVCKSSRDTQGYFNNCKLEVWEIKYCLDNDTNRFSWASASGTGVIFYMKDEWGNECHYDFKNIKFLRTKARVEDYPQLINYNPTFAFSGTDYKYFYTFDYDGIDDSLNKTGSYKCENNIIGKAMSGKAIVLNDTILVGNGNSNNVLGAGNKNNVLGADSYNNTIGVNFQNNVIVGKFFYNTIGIGFQNNNISADRFCYNAVEDLFQKNTFAKLENDETHPRIMCCSFGGSFQNNNISKDTEYSTFGIGVDKNTFGGSIKYSHIGEQMTMVEDIPNLYKTNIAPRIMKFDSTTSISELFDVNGVSLSSSIVNDSEDVVNVGMDVNSIYYVKRLSDAGGVVKIAYDDLVELKNNKNLSPGTTYRIIDYVATIGPQVVGTISVKPHKFDILVTALSKTELSHDCNACLSENPDFFEHPKTVYPSDWRLTNATISNGSWSTSVTGGIPDEIKQIYIANHRNQAEPGPESIYMLQYTRPLNAGAIDCNLAYVSGPHKLNILGVDLYRDVEKVCSYNYEYKHAGTGASQTYRVLVPEDNQYIIRIFIAKGFKPKQESSSTDTDIPTIKLDVKKLESYFSHSDVWKWKIRYDIENNRDKYHWARTPKPMADGSSTPNATEGKGVIYYMKDEYHNECPYDFKSIMFKKDNMDYYTFSHIINGSIYDSSVISIHCYENTILGHYTPEGQLKLNGNVFKNTFALDATNTICGFNKLGGYCWNNTFGNACASNVLGDYCWNNTFGDNCNLNTLGHKCEQNQLENGCENNLFGNACSNNMIGSSNIANTFGNACSNNRIGSNGSSNIFGTYCISNEFGTYFWSNIIGNACENIALGDYCWNNTFGPMCSDIKFIVEPSVGSSIIMTDVCSVNIGTCCSNLTLKTSNPNNGYSFIHYNVAAQLTGVVQITGDNIYNRQYETKIARNSKGEIKQYCEADLLDMIYNPSVPEVSATVTDNTIVFGNGASVNDKTITINNASVNGDKLIIS